MDTRFLETLVTVVECGSLAEAARRLNLTASAVAQRIQAIEAEIGVPLFARSGRTVHPTTAAVAVLERARAIQREIRDLKSVAASGLLSGELRLGVVPSMLTGFVPDVLTRFYTSHPQIELRIVRGDSADVYRDLMEKRTDVAITSEPSFVIPKTCGWSLLREEPYVVLASAMIQERDPLAILRREPFIRLHRKLHAGQSIDRYLRKKRIRPIERFELDGLDAIGHLQHPPAAGGSRDRKCGMPNRGAR
jgi:DNA-binding transcriptional LysR family regulator